MARNKHTAADIAFILSVGASAAEASLRLGVSQTYVEQLIRRGNIKDPAVQQSVMAKSKDGGWKASDNVTSYRQMTTEVARRELAPKGASRSKKTPSAKAAPKGSTAGKKTTKPFKLKPETAAFMKKFPPKAGEGPLDYLARIQKIQNEVVLAKDIEMEKKRKADSEKAIKGITPTARKAAVKTETSLPQPQEPPRPTRIQAMRAQTILARGQTPAQVARRININIKDVENIYSGRVSGGAFKDKYVALRDGKRYETSDLKDPNILKDENGLPQRGDRALRPGARSAAGLPVGMEGFRVPSPGSKRLKLNAEQKKEIKRIVTGGYGAEAIREYAYKIGQPSSTISDLAKLKKAAGVSGPTTTGVAAREKIEAAAEARRLESVARQEAAAAERARIRAIPSFKEAAKNMRYVGRPGRASPIARRNGRVGPQSTMPIIPVDTVRRVPEVNMPAHIRQAREHQRMRRAVIQPITVGGKEERYVSRQKVIGYTDKDGKYYKEGDLKPGEYEKIFDKKGKIRKGFKEVTEPVYSTRTVGGTTKMRGLRVLQGRDAPRKPFVAPPPSPKPITSGPHAGGIKAEISRESSKAGIDAVRNAIIGLHGEKGAKILDPKGPHIENIRNAIDHRIQRRIDRGLPVSPKDIAEDFTSGGGSREIIRTANLFVQDPKSPLLDRHRQAYELQEEGKGPTRYTPRGVPKAADDSGPGEKSGAGKVALREEPRVHLQQLQQRPKNLPQKQPQEMKACC